MTSTTVIAFTSISFLCFGAAMPARAQTVTPASRPADTGAQETAAIPDFSGIWAHLTWPDVEPPPAGPGAVRDMSRRNGVSKNHQPGGEYTNTNFKTEA